MRGLQDLHDATAYYTRIAVVDELLDLLAWPSCGGCLLDPGAGDGAFLVRAVERLDVAVDDVAALVRRVEGWELHDSAIGYARGNLVAHLLDRGWDEPNAEQAAREVLRHADFLVPGPTERRYRVAAGNPPYLRYARLPEPFKARYAAVPDWARQDLLHAFLARSGDLLEHDGRIGFVTADRWLFNESAARLREQLGARFGVERVRRLDPSTSFYQAKTRRKGTPPRIHPVAVVLGPNGARLSREPVYLDSVAVPDGARPLGTVATVRLAPWLGPAGIFVMERTTEFVRSLPRSAYVACVDTDDIAGGVLTKPKRVAFRVDRDRKPHASVVRHVRTHRWRLSPRALRSQTTCPWAAPESWGALPYDCESLLVPRIARELTTVRLPARVLPINHNLTVISSTIPLDRLEAALSSTFAKAWIAAHAARLENGYLSITTNLLRRLPVAL